MNLRFKDKGIVEIDDARIIWPNFSGAPTDYNRDGGKPEFNIVIPDDELAQALLDAGWNVKIRPPRDVDEQPLRTLKIKVGFRGYRPPSIWIVAGENRSKVTEDTLHRLDKISIDHVDLDISPYHSNGHQTAYLQGMVVYKRMDRFEERFADEEYPEE